MENRVVFFDGVCNLCNGAVQFIIERDAAAKLRFASLDSETARQILEKNNSEIVNYQSIIFFEEGKIYDRSTAVLRIARHMDGAWKLCFALLIVPRPIRDAVYNWVARNRYKWFGKAESCWIPTPELQKRFEK